MPANTGGPQLDRFVAASEHLKAFVDSTLEAFQTGAGHITHAIARQMLWDEIQRTLLSLPSGPPVCNLRLSLVPQKEFVALELLSAFRETWQWAVRTLGPQHDGDPVVMYVTGVVATEVEPLHALRTLLEALRVRGIEVRDYSLNLH